MSQGCMRVGKSDFYEGIRAVLVDKDHSPQWMHGSVEDGGLEKVTADIVEEFFVKGEGGQLWTTGE